ncbi:catalytic protein [Purpureocillium lavendulum]|uniref:Catalytic protein n=1 Tax=Purpureocillium lavendulum TaxID=1247861 RepID=A0AB34FJL8_9HYPO|nr:catalytic protein [Purpureocillium lavendulum]
MTSPPPPLPPRAPGQDNRMAPAGSESQDFLGLLRGDPRSSSTQSLAPSVSGETSRRTLLVIYIHGFYGNDQSFRSFPAHVHALLRTLLADSHVIHSKIYPRYKTYKAIEVARDNFSAWLEPHESPTTDVILVGHSMGGLLAGEVVLVPNQSPYRLQAFKHRIVGTLSLDSPFLGLHPGIVVSGISSLFQTAPKAADSTSDDAFTPPPSSPSSLAPTPSINSRLESSASSFSSPPVREDSDPHYDPPYWNDEPFRERPFIKRLVNFTAKHRSEGIFSAVRNHVVSHLEFGGCLADYRGLVGRYNMLRALENIDELQAIHDGHPPGAHNDSGATSTPRISVEAPPDELLEQRHSNDLDKSQTKTKETTADSASPPDLARISMLSMHDIDPIPMADDAEPVPRPDPEPHIDAQEDDLVLPPIPDEPQQPVLPDLDAITDKDARKQAERESKRLQKAYTQAVKDRAKAIRERDKLLEKRRKRAQKDADKVEKKAQKEQLRLDREEKKRLAMAKQAVEPQSGAVDDADQWEDSPAVPSLTDRTMQVGGDKPKKLRKFCNLPGKTNGVRDETWVDVYMDGMDEVGAHCGLFAPGPHYEKLVGDVGSRIVGWVHDDMTKRALLEAECD